MTKTTSFLLFLCFVAIWSCQADKTPTAATASVELQPADITDQMLGQLIMVGFRGMYYDSLSPLVKEQIESGEIGSIILFDYDVGYKKAERNIATPEQVTQLLTDLQAAAPNKLLTAIDQEGGRVMRLKEKYGFQPLPSAQYLGEQTTTDSTTYYASQNAQNLRALGFNVNFAPVVDLNVNPESPVIGAIGRSFGASSSRVTTYARAWVTAHEAAGILSVLKHFPGHGSSEADSHLGFTDVTDSWTSEELLPYQALLTDDTDLAVMTAHVFNRNIDSIYPATLSPNYVQAILRDSFQYNGLVFSDDLQMNAVSKRYDFETIIRQSLRAGVDILVFGNNLENYKEGIAREAIKVMRKLLDQGQISAERVMLSYERIQEVKKD